MNAVRQSCRPKHQVLVLKCYPRYQKSQTSVKPNGSELSYLLYYASTRRSKLPKVGNFLDKRTASDVWHVRIGNVQVSLEIVRALIEKCGRDLPLFAGAVLRILKTVLKSGDVTMVESTAEVWDEFCKVQDPARLAADQDYIRQYEEVLQLYVDFASKDRPQTVKGNVNVPVAMRFRKVGLEAIKSIADSETISAETARQLNLTLPVVLENLYSTDPAYLQILQQREMNKEQLEKELTMRRRQSIATVRTVEDGDADPVAALGTTADADKLAEQDIGIIALQALRQIFAGTNRGQLRLATSSVLRFVAARVRVQDHFSAQDYHTLQLASWPTSLFGVLCQWAPVQDRYVILVTAMETLVRSPIVEADLEKQFVLANIIGWLLNSPINFIGLSVMDVLVGLMQHISLLLQLGGQDSDIRPHHQQIDVFSDSLAHKEASSQPSATEHRDSAPVVEIAQTPSEERVRLLNQLLQCIGNLATHVYYSDQVSDMIIAIMKRLKPFPVTNASSTASAIQDPSGAVETLARSVSLHEKPNTDHFFSFDTARVAALQAVKAIVIVANGRAHDGSSNAAGRSKIGTSVWAGTQWLLRDPSYQVRLAYHDALVTWLTLESQRADLKIAEDAPKRKPSSKKENGNAKMDSLARRAVSNASQREKSPGAKRNTFLDLLHLAIYENAHQYAEFDQDILLLHSLLSSLVQKLGVNSVRSGLPMVACLQTEIPSFESPISKVNIASLVHGYFWALAVSFDFDASATARTVLNEITRRTQNGVWLQSIRVPPLPPQQAGQTGTTLGVGTAISSTGTAGVSEGTVGKLEGDSLKPFDNRAALVDKIAQGYSMSLYSPPSSPPGSPNRSFSVPMLATVGRSRSISMQQGGNLRAPSPTRSPPELPLRIRDEMLSDWSRDSCIAGTVTESSRSITGSGRASGSVNDNSRSRKHLAVDVPPGSSNGNGAIHGAQQLKSSDHLASPKSSHHPFTPTSGNAAHRSSSRGATPSPTPLSTSSVRSGVRVEDLKKVLAGATAGGGALRTAWSMRGSSAARWSSNQSSFGDGDADTASDSMVSADVSTIDNGVPSSIHIPLPPGTDPPPAHDDGHVEEEEQERHDERAREVREGSSTPRPMSGHAHADSADTIRPHLDRDAGAAKPASADADDEYIPPVPPLPVDFQYEQRGRQIDTDAESSVYMTPGESPAPPLSRVETSTSTATAETAHQAPQTETPRAPRESYFDEVRTPLGPSRAQPVQPESPETAKGMQTPRRSRSPPPDPLGQEAIMGISSQPREIFVENKRRSASAHQNQQQGSPRQTRKSLSRSASSGTGNMGITSGGSRPASFKQRDSMRSFRSGTTERGPSGGFSRRESMRVGGPVDARGLLDGIEVDGYAYSGDGGTGRPPY